MQENMERKELLEASASQSKLEAALRQAQDDAEHERSEKERVSTELRVKQEELDMKEKEAMRTQMQVPPAVLEAISDGMPCIVRADSRIRCTAESRPYVQCGGM